MNDWSMTRDGRSTNQSKKKKSKNYRQLLRIERETYLERFENWDNGNTSKTCFCCFISSSSVLKLSYDCNMFRKKAVVIFMVSIKLIANYMHGLKTYRLHLFLCIKLVQRKRRGTQTVMEDTNRKNNEKELNNVIPVQVLNWESEIKDDQKQ